MSSGGPFFRDIEVNDTGTTINITHYMFSGHEQTEDAAARPARPVRDGGHQRRPPRRGQPRLPVGLHPGAALRRPARHGERHGERVVRRANPRPSALAGPNGQYWAPVQGGRFSIGRVRPGTYTATLYAGELAVGTTNDGDRDGRRDDHARLSGSVPATGTLFQTRHVRRHAGRLPQRRQDRDRCTRPTCGWPPGRSTVAAGSGASGLPDGRVQVGELADRGHLHPGRGAVRRRHACGSPPPRASPAAGRRSSIGGWNSPASASPAPTKI